MQGYLAHQNTHPSPGPLQGPRHGLTVGSEGRAVSYERDTPVRADSEREGGWFEKLGWFTFVLVVKKIQQSLAR